jgi:hypothetical protein
MPVFDHSASRLGRAETELVRSVLGPAKPRTTSLRPFSREYRRRQVGASITRAVIVLALLAGFCGSAMLMSETQRPPPGATLLSSPRASQEPALPHAGAWPAPPGSLPLNETTHRRPTEGPGGADTATRMFPTANDRSGALHARSC